MTIHEAFEYVSAVHPSMSWATWKQASMRKQLWALYYKTVRKLGGR